MEITGTLKNAEHAETCLRGQIYGDARGRFRDGEWIRTSYIVSEDGDTFTTRNSVYKVESWACDPVNDTSSVMEGFQGQVDQWMVKCFSREVANDIAERNHRFLEEALELVQANGATVDEAHMLADYVFSRKTGDVAQELGGVMLTLAALANASGFYIHTAGIVELDRVNRPEVIEKIRAKQATKPASSPLPGDA